MPQPRKLHDRFFKQAKAEGYLARSAYKLKEIQERYPLIRPGDFVLDLGCAPGSWLQVASELTGRDGVVVGIDLKPTDERALAWGPARVVAKVGDAFTADASSLLSELGVEHRMFDVLLSDMAPNTSGHGDDLLSSRLCRRVLELAPAVLRPGGMLAMKILEGSEYPAVLAETGAMFSQARGYKPQSSRDVSREIFIIARNFVGPSQSAGTRRVGKGGPPKPGAGWGGGWSEGSGGGGR